MKAYSQIGRWRSFSTDSGAKERTRHHYRRCTRLQEHAQYDTPSVPPQHYYAPGQSIRQHPPQILCDWQLGLLEHSPSKCSINWWSSGYKGETICSPNDIICKNKALETHNVKDINNISLKYKMRKEQKRQKFQNSRRPEGLINPWAVNYEANTRLKGKYAKLTHFSDKFHRLKQNWDWKLLPHSFWIFVVWEIEKGIKSPRRTMKENQWDRRDKTKTRTKKIRSQIGSETPHRSIEKSTKTYGLQCKICDITNQLPGFMTTKRLDSGLRK